MGLFDGVGAGLALTGAITAGAVHTASTIWGDRFEVIIPLVGPTGKTADITTAWIIRPGDNRPHLVTAYVALP